MSISRDGVRGTLIEIQEEGSIVRVRSEELNARLMPDWEFGRDGSIDRQDALFSPRT